jgi:hypothetical protein
VVELVVLLALCVSVGFAAGMWWAILVPLAASAVFYVGRWQEWWGYGTGEAWVYLMIFFGGLGALAAGVGVVLRKLTGRAVRA